MTLTEKQNRKRMRFKIRRIIIDAKSKPCVICGIQYAWWVMQFDHLNPYEKKKKVGECRTMKEMCVEIAKCQVVCANCHADLSYKNRHSVPNQPWYQDTSQMEFDGIGGGV